MKIKNSIGFDINLNIYKTIFKNKNKVISIENKFI